MIVALPRAATNNDTRKRCDFNLVKEQCHLNTEVETLEITGFGNGAESVEILNCLAIKTIDEIDGLDDHSELRQRKI